ncbi:MAG: trypsin-like peptidase domain-containing protein [Firmicutes bacterium]|nr:trypsin-like peptidase domain-containing protein [Bacillota bacterium]
MKQKTTYIVTIIVTLFVGIIGTIAVIKFLPGTKEVVNRTVKDVSITEKDSIKEAIAKIKDAVVVIESYKNGQKVSQGSGFVYKKEDKKGYVITNHHVISGADEIKVVNNNEQTVTAKLLGSDELSDLAVLSIDESAVMSVATLGSSAKTEVGDTVFTVGTPLGDEYKGTVTKGILSGKDRMVSVSTNSGGFIMEVLQTDAAMNPGNSGGPLVNINGEVIGVNSLKLVEDEIEGMGFAIPIEMVQTELEYLETGKTITRPKLGIEFADITNSYLLYRNGIMLDKDIKDGIVVITVSSDSPASNAGFQKGDVITKMDNTDVKNTSHFRYLLYKHKVGDTVTIKYIRDGKEKEVKVSLNQEA